MNSDELRQKNIEIFKQTIKHLGNQEFDLCVSHLSKDVVCEWPFIPNPDLEDTMMGRETIKAMFQQMKVLGFEPYNYEFDTIHALEDPGTVIAEYHAQSLHRPSGKRYANKYISILKFEDEKITFWREYLNPLPVYEVLNITPGQ